MGFFMKLYMSRLKTHPITTNLGTAFLIMTTGDIMAQELEHFHLDEAITRHDDDNDDAYNQKIPPSRRLNLRRYGIHDHYDEDDWEKRFREMERFKPTGPPSNLRYDDCEESTSNWSEAFEVMIDFVWRESHHLDLVRTSSMGFWAVAFYTPFYMWLYKTFDRMFPRKTTLTIMARVLSAVVLSFPVNSMFFSYGTFVHHTLEWVEMRREWKVSLKEDEEWEREWTLYEQNQQQNQNHQQQQNQQHKHPLHLSTIPPPYDLDMMISKCELKIETELLTTVKNSAKMWIPINYMNFAFVPPHLRPLGLSVASVFWNCYLSLVQHRDITLPDEFDHGEMVEVEGVDVDVNVGVGGNEVGEEVKI